MGSGEREVGNDEAQQSSGEPDVSAVSDAAEVTGLAPAPRVARAAINYAAGTTLIPMNSTCIYVSSCTDTW